MLFGLVIGGMFFGVFAPSEAAAIGAFGSFVLITIRGQLKRSVMVTSLVRSARITCSVMFVIVGALVFNVFLATSGFATAFTNWMLGLPVSPWVILVISLLMYIPLGAFMDELALMMLTLPIIAPVISGLGFDLVWYGILVTVMLQFGLLTPPIALAAYVVQGVTKVPLWEIYRWLTPFLIALLVGLGFLIVFPEITLLVPHLMPTEDEERGMKPRAHPVRTGWAGASLSGQYERIFQHPQFLENSVKLREAFLRRNSFHLEFGSPRVKGRSNHLVHLLQLRLTPRNPFYFVFACEGETFFVIFIEDTGAREGKLLPVVFDVFLRCFRQCLIRGFVHRPRMGRRTNVCHNDVLRDLPDFESSRHVSTGPVPSMIPFCIAV